MSGRSDPAERQRLIDSGKYTEEVMAKAEELFWATPPRRAPKNRFETWLETATAPTQSFMARQAIYALGR